MHYYKHHIGDFIRDTANLNDSQTVAYLRLIWKYYQDESPLHGSCERIAFAIGSDALTVELILEHYFKKDGDLWRHARIDRELSGIYEKSEKARNAAKARWKNADAMQTHSGSNADAPKNDATHKPINPLTHKPNINTPLTPQGGKSGKASPKKKPPAKKPETFATPEGVDAKIWADFVEHRTDIKKPLTEKAAKIAGNLLAGRPVDIQRQIVERTIVNRWTGLFEPREGDVKKVPPEKKFTNYESTPIEELSWMRDDD